MERVSFSPIVRKQEKKGGPRNQRDELFDFFFAQLSGPWRDFTKQPLRKAYFAKKIAHLKDKDLYYMKSVCMDAERRGQPFSRTFWGMLKLPENKK